MKRDLWYENESAKIQATNANLTGDQLKLNPGEKARLSVKAKFEGTATQFTDKVIKFQFKDTRNNLYPKDEPIEFQVHEDSILNSTSDSPLEASKKSYHSTYDYPLPKDN